MDGQHDLMDRYGSPLKDKTNHPFYLAIAACKAAEAAVNTDVLANSQASLQEHRTTTGTSTTTENFRNNDSHRSDHHWQIASSEPPLNVGQTISYQEAALIGTSPEVRRDGSCQH